MGSVHPFYEFNHVVRQKALEILAEDEAGEMFEYTHPLGTHRQALAGARWLQHMGLDASADCVLIASGVQSALAVLLTALFEPGDALAVDAYTYPNFIGLARQLHLRLVAVEGDGEGMLPDALENACISQNVKGLYLMPAGANPTNIVMSEIRKSDLAHVASSRGIIVLEDDNQAAMLPCRPTPFAQRYPRGSIYLGGLSKSVCAGLRIAYVHVPAHLVDRVTRSAYNHNLKIPSLNIEIATQLIDSGQAERLARARLERARERNELYHRAFPSLPFDRNSLTQWMPLPPSMTGHQCEHVLAGRGVSVFGADRFAVGEHALDDHLRVSTCSPRTTDELAEGLEILRDTLRASNDEPLLIV